MARASDLFRPLLLILGVTCSAGVKIVPSEVHHQQPVVDVMYDLVAEHAQAVAGLIPTHPVLRANYTARIDGLRVEMESRDVSYQDGGVSLVMADTMIKIRFFGRGFTKYTIVRFVTEAMERGQDCDDVSSTKAFQLPEESLTNDSASCVVDIPPLDTGETYYYVCVRESDIEMPWVHQGTDEWVMLTSYEKTLPLWLEGLILIVLMLFSGLFSGLNLGLMALDPTELKIVANTGTAQEQMYAKAIQPLRNNGNYLLCSLLLSNVLVNSTLTILLDNLTSGLVAIIGSTLGIVLFGEIIPQAVCSRHGLAIGAKTVWVTKLFMVLTFPLSYPISIILNRVLGEEIGNVYNRERLKELLRVTHGYNDLEKEELNIISGALEMKKKTVADVMTRLEDVFMLPINSFLDFETVSEIMNQGYSRIPVYDEERSNILSILYTKDLVFVDPDDKMPLKTLCDFYHNPCNFVFDNTTLDVMFNEFKGGNKGHMAFVQVVNDVGDGDPFYEPIGIVTLEDVIEELIQAEIVDETDVWVDNSQKSRRKHAPNNGKQDFSLFLFEKKDNHNKPSISPQLTLATFQYLSTMEAFKKEHISEAILHRLLQQKVIFHIRIKSKEKARYDPQTIIYEQGKPADYFVLILEGRVEVTMGQENLVFESGSFTYFGVQCLNTNIGLGEAPSTPTVVRSRLPSIHLMETLLHHTFVPDYTVRAVSDVCYLKIHRPLYQAAKQATLLEMTCREPSQVDEEQLEEEIDKVMNSYAGGLDHLDRISSATASTERNSSHGSSDDEVKKPVKDINTADINPVEKHYSEKLDSNTNEDDSKSNLNIVNEHL